MLVLEAHAKVNLALEILGRRSDGFHDLVSVMQTVSLADTLTFEHADGISFTCSEPELEGPGNLVHRAATMLRDRFGSGRGCAIHLIKRIPQAAGLGGGSSDAAAALVGLNRLWRLGLDCSALLDLAQELGSDVPYFLFGGTALVAGRGERVRRLSRDPWLWYVLANPGVAVSTGDVFAALPGNRWGAGRETRELARSIEAGEATSPGPNDLKEGLFQVDPTARDFLELVERCTGGRAFLSGSGPTVGAIFDSEDDAQHAGDGLRSHVPWVTVASTWVPAEGSMPCA